VKHPVAKCFAVDVKASGVVLAPQLERLVSVFPVAIEELAHHRAAPYALRPEQ
jgi:hypothetical protein